MSKDVMDRFLARVHKDEETGCWIFVGSRNAQGYGMLWSSGKLEKAHRVSWQLYCGPIPNGLLVLHDCPCGDNPTCVNPDHLWLGTQKENVADTWRKGRMCAEKMPLYCKRLTKEMRESIPGLILAGHTTKQVAALLKVPHTTIRGIIQTKFGGVNCLKNLNPKGSAE
jgi:hypothetical protein